MPGLGSDLLAPEKSSRRECGESLSSLVREGC